MTEEEYLQMMMAQGGSQGGLLGGGYSPPSFPSVTPEQQAMVSQSPVRTRGQGIVGAIGGLLGGLGRAVGPGLQQASRAIYGDDEITRLRRQNAFAAMTLNPNQALITSNAAQIKGLQEQDLATASAADIAEYLRGRGRHAEAALVERNPELASTVLAPEFRAGNTYAPQMDPKTGEYYVTRVTPTGEVEILKTGQFGETPETEGQRELQAQLTLQDRQTAMSRGVEAMGAANILQGNVEKYIQALKASESGAQSGAIRQFLPALDAQTAQLRRLGSLLGIDIINSATFGALSATELNLALSTGLDLSLPPAELQEDLRRRLAASQKLYDEYIKIAETLSSGDVLYSDYIKSIPHTPLVPPQDMEGNFLVSPAIWDQFTRDEKVEFFNEGRK